MCAEVDEAIENGAEFIILSDRDSNKDLTPIPSLLMVSAIHHHLIRRENRMKVGLIVEAGDVREVHHVATLIGYGASASTRTSRWSRSSTSCAPATSPASRRRRPSRT
jgi:glutamate synthase (NADPH/NADH) large chain